MSPERIASARRFVSKENFFLRVFQAFQPISNVNLQARGGSLARSADSIPIEY